MTLWVGQDGSYNDDDGDGAASIDETSAYDDADRNPALMNFLDIPSTINEEIPIETEHTVVVHDQPVVIQEASAPAFEVTPELPMLDVEPMGGGGTVIMPGPVPILQERLPWWHRHHHHHMPPVFMPEPHLPHPHHLPVPPLSRRGEMLAHGAGGCPPGMFRNRAGKCVAAPIATHGEFTGWQEPFTDWNGDLLEGMGQYGVTTVTDPWEPATYPDVLYPPADQPPYVWPAGKPIPPYTPPEQPPQQQATTPPQPESPLSTPAAPGTPTAPHFGPPPHGTRPRGPARARASSPSTMARGAMMTGFDVPFTDDDGHLLMDPHPSHRDWPYPMTYGDPVMTGWDAPLTDLEGQLLSGPGQYGQFTMEDPYDHRNFNSVNLEAENLIGDPLYFYTGDEDEEDYMTGADDGASQFGSALGNMFGSATGDTSGSFGQAGGAIASSIEQGADSGDWGSALGSIASSVAKVAVPAVIKAVSSSSSSSSNAPTLPGGAPTQSAPPAPTQPAPHRAAPVQNRAQLVKLMKQLRALAPRYGIAVPTHVAPHAAAPAQSTAQQLQGFMQSVAPQG